MKEQQKFEYRVYDSMGRRTEVFYSAYNSNEAFKLFRDDKANFSQYYYGKLKREYNRGYHISEDKR
jgi:hypothetical protein